MVQFISSPKPVAHSQIMHVEELQSSKLSKGRVMKERKFGKTICCCFALGLLLLPAGTVQAQESFRISRPDANVAPQPDPSDATPAEPSNSPMQSEQVPATGSPPATASTDLLQSKAILNLEGRATPPYQKAIIDWQNRNLPHQPDGSNDATTNGSDNSDHRGLKAHIGSKFSTLAALGMIPYVHTSSAPPREPTIWINTGLCPEMFDPAFRVPTKWWAHLGHEGRDRTLGPQWKLWLSALRLIFQAHASQLRATPGLASLHVIVNPDGSLVSVVPYDGPERRNPQYPLNERTMANLTQVLLNMGRFPPFPAGSQVPCYHLIINGSGGY